MFNFIKKLFNKKPNKTDTTSFMCSINFELNHDGTINIICYWPNFDQNNMDKIAPVSLEFGTLLHMINNGMLKTEVINTLNSLTDKSNNFDNIFINMCLLKLIEYSEKENSTISCDPLVKPSSVFKQYGIK